MFSNIFIGIIGRSVAVSVGDKMMNSFISLWSFIYIQSEVRFIEIHRVKSFIQFPQKINSKSILNFLSVYPFRFNSVKANILILTLGKPSDKNCVF